MGEYELNLQTAVEHANAGDHGKAIDYYLKAVEKRWWCHQALMGLAGSYTWLGRFREAMQVFIRSAACFPQESPDYFVIKNRIRTFIIAENDHALLSYVIHALWVINRNLKHNFFGTDFLADMLMLKGEVALAIEKKHHAAICHAAFSKSEDLSGFSRDRGKLPDFFVIGPQKTATTALYSRLVAHPKVYPAINKELFFFNGPMYRYGRDWYEANFPSPAGGRQFLTGEATATYFHSPVAPARMREIVPAAKLIFTVREPSARAISSFFMEKRHGREPRSLYNAISAEIDYLEKHDLPPGGHPIGMFAPNRVGQGGYVLFSLYEHFLRVFRETFPQERMLVVKSENLRSGGGAFISVLEFLGLEQLGSPEEQAVQETNVGEYTHDDEYHRTRGLLDDFFRSRKELVGEFY